MTLDAAEVSTSIVAIETADLDLPITQPIDISALITQQGQTQH